MCIEKTKNDGIEDMSNWNVAFTYFTSHTDAYYGRRKTRGARLRTREGGSERKFKEISRHHLFSVVIRARLVVCSLQLDSIFPPVCQGDHLLRVLQLCSWRNPKPATGRMWAGEPIDVDIDNRHYDGDWYNFHSYFEGRQKSSGEDWKLGELHW